MPRIAGCCYVGSSKRAKGWNRKERLFYYVGSFCCCLFFWCVFFVWNMSAGKVRWSIARFQISCWNACVYSTTTKVSVICSSYSTLKERVDSVQTVHCSDFDQQTQRTYFRPHPFCLLPQCCLCLLSQHSAHQVCQKSWLCVMCVNSGVVWCKGECFKSWKRAGPKNVI